MNYLANTVGRVTLPPALLAQLAGNPRMTEPKPARSRLPMSRRIERAFPARIAERITSIMVGVTEDEKSMLAEAKNVFKGVGLELVQDLAEPERKRFRARLSAEQAELLDRFHGRGAITVYRAMHFWLQETHNRGKLSANDGEILDENGPFMRCFGLIGEAFKRDEENMRAWNKCERSAMKMAAEWRAWFERRNYYR